MPKTPSSRPYFIGIDPGKQGGLVCLRDKIHSITPMPSSERDVWDWFSMVTYSCSSAVAVIERVHARPRQGVSSMFKFGCGYGGLRMALIAAGIPFEDVTPQTWLRDLSISPRKKTKTVLGVKPKESDRQWKEQLRAKAQQLFPRLSLWKEPKSKGKQLAVADALLIAEFCRRRNS